MGNYPHPIEDKIGASTHHCFVRKFTFLMKIVREGYYAKVTLIDEVSCSTQNFFYLCTIYENTIFHTRDYY